MYNDPVGGEGLEMLSDRAGGHAHGFGQLIDRRFATLLERRDDGAAGDREVGQSDLLAGQLGWSVGGRGHGSTITGG
jgi:hypothetical protein